MLAMAARSTPPTQFCTAACETGTGRERRKQRNERRAELTVTRREALQQQPQKLEEFWEGKIISKRATSRNGDASLSKLAQRGVQWYAVRVYKGRESTTSQALRDALAAQCPNQEIEVFCPMVPVERTYNGKPRLCSRALLPGFIFISCILEPKVYHIVRNDPAVFSFSGFTHKMKEGYNSKLLRGGYPDVQIPEPVSAFQVEALLAETKKAWEDEKNQVCK